MATQYTQEREGTPSSKEPKLAMQLQHRFEPIPCGEAQAARIPAVGRRHLANAWQADKDARNAEATRRQLAGRRSAATLEWLLRRQQERSKQQEEEERSRGRRKAPGGLIHNCTSPTHPLCIKKRQQQAEDPQRTSSVPSPAEMAAALTAMGLEGGAADAEQQQEAAGSCSTCGSDGSEGACSCKPAAGADGSSSSNCGAAPGECSAAAAAAVPGHLAGHLELGSLMPQADTAEHRGRKPGPEALKSAQFRQQELDEVMAGLLEQYPHGIPRKMLLDLRQLGLSDGPSLGYGCISSSAPLAAALVTKTL